MMDASSPAGPRAVHEHVRLFGDQPSVAARTPDHLSIGEPERTAIHAALAEARRLADHDPAHPQPAHVRLPMGYRAAISFELHAAGLYRHLWIYMEKPGSLPTMPSIRLIAGVFGFDLDGAIERHTWVEQLAPGHHAANILEMQTRTPRPTA